MKYYSLLLACLCTTAAIAQKHKKAAPPKPVAAKPAQKPVEYTLLKGHIANYTDKTLYYYAQTYFGTKDDSVNVNNDGSFVVKIPADMPYRTVTLTPGDNHIPVLFIGKDTLQVSWDDKDVEKTVKITAGNADLGKQLTDYMVMYKNHINHRNDVSSKLYEKGLTDSGRFAMINKAFNEDFEVVTSKPITAASEKHAVDVYFDYTDMLRHADLLTHYQLELKNKPDPNSQLGNLVNNKNYPPYKKESDWFFKVSPSYRDFIFDYVRFENVFTMSMFSGDTQQMQEASRPFAPALKDYHLGMAAFSIYAIRDWFMTRSIFEDFENYSFADATWVYQTYLPQIKTSFYADTLKKYYAQIQTLKPGGPAPVFKLKDESGKTVSLNDFRGKNVYIDFWGVGCGPCVYDITNYVPKLHEKYKDKDVVFVNICVDANETEWKDKLKTLNLHGVNLLAEGWTKNPVCKAYNVNSIPHYYLVNNRGQIVDNNSKRPNGGIDGDLDKLLKQ